MTFTPEQHQLLAQAGRQIRYVLSESGFHEKGHWCFLLSDGEDWYMNTSTDAIPFLEAALGYIRGDSVRLKGKDAATEETQA